MRGSPFVMAGTRQGSNPSADYQRPGGAYQGPRGPAGNVNDPFSRSPIPDSPSAYGRFGRRSAEEFAKQSARRAAKLMARSLIRRIPIGDALDLASHFMAVAPALAAHPDYSPHYVYSSQCSPRAPDPAGAGWVTYMKPASGDCNGAEGWSRGAEFPNQTPSGPLFRAYRYEVGADITTAWAKISMVENWNGPGTQLWDAEWITYTRVVGQVGNATYKGMIPARLPIFWPIQWPRPGERPSAFPFPSVDPMVNPPSKPGGAPGQRPMPLPYRWLPQWQPNPWAVPGEAPARGPNRENSPWRRFDPKWVPAIPIPSRGPSYAGQSERKAIEVTESGIRRVPSEHRRQAQKGRKELKTKSAAGAMVLKVINEVTEATDYIDAVWESLPKKFQRLKSHRGLRQMRSQHKLAAIAANWRELSMFEVARNLFENEVIDRVFGAAGKGLVPLNRAMGRPVGVEAGGALGGGKSSVTGNKGPSPWKDFTEHFVPKTN